MRKALAHLSLRSSMERGRVNLSRSQRSAITGKRKSNCVANLSRWSVSSRVHSVLCRWRLYSSSEKRGISTFYM